ncbi:MAG: YbaB/EbfC family nucleoid-associated protein [Planctomycetota bacterium]|nr:YbaB/EbfC family nucleoid-associated protein [Planctomycetota bacterium]
MDMRHLLEQAKNLERALSEIDKRLETFESEGQSADGGIVVRVNGVGEVVSLSIAPEIVEEEDHETLEALILEALGAATAAARKFREEQRAALTGGLKLPDF